MKITLRPAAKLRQATKVKQSEKEPTMLSVVQRFINGPLKTNIEDALCYTDRYGINEQVPHEAYRNLPLFYKLCSEALTPLGYSCEESHDGGGMFSTLYVSWAPKKKVK